LSKGAFNPVIAELTAGQEIQKQQKVILPSGKLS